MLNRSALIVRPAGPYLEWAASLDDSGLVPDPCNEQTVYLIPEWEDKKDVERILKVIWPEVFERELHGWHTDESAWPQKRSFKMFKQWFTVEIHSIVEDLCAYELQDDDR